MHVAALTTGAALAALLIGPAVTWGLDVPVVGGSDGAATQVAATAQGVVTTVEQTTRSAVTTVENAVPATAVPATPATPVVQTTVRAVTAPVQKQTAVAPVHKAPVTRVSTRLVRRTPQVTSGSLRAAAPVPALKPRVRSKPFVVASARGRSAAPEAASSQCDSLPALPVLPGGIDVRALLTIVCNAAGNVLTPARIGTPGVAKAGVSLADVLNAVATGGPSRGVRGAGYGHPRAAADPAVAASAAGYRGDSAAGARGVRWTGTSSQAPSSGAGPPPGQLRSRPAAATTRHARSGHFSNPVNATNLLSLVLILDAAFLAAIVLWRMARRWVVPRFA